MKINMESSISWQKETFCKRKKGRGRKNSVQHLFQIRGCGEPGGESWQTSLLQPEDSFEPPHVQKRSEGENKMCLQLILQSSSNFT